MKKIYKHIGVLIVIVIILAVYIAEKGDNQNSPVEGYTTSIDSIKKSNENIERQIVTLDSIRHEEINNANDMSDSAAVELFNKLIHR